jgi:hypothetical protein
MTAEVYSSSRLRVPGLLFVSSLVSFILLMAIAIGVVLPAFPAGMGVLTPEQMQNFRSVFVLFQAWAIVPILLGTLGIALLYPILKQTSAGRIAWLGLICASLTSLLYFVLIVLRLTLVSFSEASLNDNFVWQWTSWAFDKPGLILLSITTLFVGISLYRSNLLKRTGLIVAILSIILTFMAIIIGYPPFVFGFLWLAIGIGLLTRK